MSDVAAPTSGEEYDPFAVFDEAAGAGTVTDPYPVFRELRAECPVRAGSFQDRFGADEPVNPAFLDDSAVPHTPLALQSVQAWLMDAGALPSSGPPPHPHPSTLP